MSNRIDSQIDDFLKLFEMMDERAAQKERERLDEKRLAQLERESGCNDE